jgi:hypothetical protein
MGMCKGCNEVYNANEIIDGLCQQCRKGHTNDINNILKDNNISITQKINTIRTKKDLSNNEKLNLISKLYLELGYAIDVKTNNQLQMIRKKTFSFLWAFLWFLLLGFGLIVYLLYYMSKKDDLITITLDNETKDTESKSDSNSIADEIKKLSDLLEQKIITEDEFNTQKTKLLN